MVQDGDLDMATATFDTFGPHIGDAFAIDGQAFTLLTVEVIGEPFQPGARVPFELVFSGPPEVPQRLYRLVHAELGGVLLFLVPRAVDRYSAIVS